MTGDYKGPKYARRQARLLAESYMDSPPKRKPGKRKRQTSKKNLISMLRGRKKFEALLRRGIALNPTPNVDAMLEKQRSNSAQSRAMSPTKLAAGIRRAILGA